MMKRIAAFALSLSMILGMSSGAYACTEIYVGSNHTADGNTIAARSEDIYSDYPKTFDVYQTGTHKENEEYKGCYGFTWTFTHDSYSFTAFSDDNSDGVCPDCGSTHPHTPYQAGGTNEKGLTVIATETLYVKDEAKAADPFPENSIEEAEITTVLLSEADSARGALDLLTSIIDESGSAAGAGILLIDRDESWYIENLTGTQYLAVQLNPDMIMVCPNLSVLGRIDLDDTEHVIVSDKLIETAVKAGTFVGDEKENVIDFCASFERDPEESQAQRLACALNYLTGTEDYQADNTELLFDRSACTITNLDQDGNIVLPCTNITLAKDLDLEQTMKLYQQSPIGKTGNIETHIFEYDPEDQSETGITEWFSMGDDRWNVFIPFYPMLTEEVSDYLSVGQGQPMIAEITEDKPDSQVCFEAGDFYYGFPEQWDQTMYWPFEYLSHVCTNDEEAAAAVRSLLDDLQAEVMKDWEEMKNNVENADGDQARIATESSMEITDKVCQGALDICASYPVE